MPRSAPGRDGAPPQVIERTARWAVGIVVAAVVLLLGTMPGAAIAAPITFNTALPVAQGQAIFRLQWKFVEFRGDRTSADRDLSVQVVPLVGVWGVTKRVALFGILPLIDREVDLRTPLGRMRRSASGLGDTTLLVRYTAYQRDEPGKTLRIAPFLGVEAPTGEDSQSDSLGPLPPAFQLGSGSWDVQAGAILTRQALAWQTDVSLSYKLNGEANDFEFGDQTRLDASYQRRLHPLHLEAGVPAYVYAVVESNLLWRDRSTFGGVEDVDTGGVIWYLAPGLQYVRRRFVVEGAVQIPVAQNLDGSALEDDFISTLSVRFNF